MALKIQNTMAPTPSSGTLRAASAAETPAEHAVLFKRTLSVASGEAREEHLRALIAKIDDQAERLSEHTDVAEFARYRQYIKDFLDDLVSNGYEFDKQSVFGGRGRARYLVTVRTIDEKLDQLGKEVLSGQADNLSVLHATDDIRGLILDVYT
ncbi:MAG: YaaR family protein [Oscillospiraceae bacterium]|jgi:uncharacterized protein YaaR (DUF327 family)|nr:YaaR family protein [Oscillospiraceae bacterium]